MKRKDRMKSTLMAPKWTRVGVAAVTNCHYQNGETTCRQLSKRLPGNSTIFAAEDTAISLALNYYQHMGPVHNEVVVYSHSMSCLQGIEGEDTENPLICHIINLLWLLSERGTRVRFCWIPSHCGIEGNERVNQLAKETLDQEMVRPTDCLSPLLPNTEHWPYAPHGGYLVNSSVHYGSHMGTRKEPKIDMSISPLKRLSTRWFKCTQFNVAILMTMRRPNKLHLVEMRCYWWLKNRHVDHNVRSVQAESVISAMHFAGEAVQLRILPENIHA